jgi:uncharacterized protein YsxB (DUF464 family)
MNPKLLAYLELHGKVLDINGVPELVLSADKMQGFLDLIQPSDVPPDKLQLLYAMQETLVQKLRSLAEGSEPRKNTPPSNHEA